MTKGLVVFQFSLATFLIVASLVVYSQFNFLMHFDLGYDDKNIAIVNTGQIDREKLDVFRNELLKSPSIESVSAEQGEGWEPLHR